MKRNELKTQRSADDLLLGLPDATLDCIAGLVADGYAPYKRWANGVELRKGAGFSEWKFALQVLLVFLVPSAPFVMRQLVANWNGYRHRLLVTIDPAEPLVHFF